MNINQIFKSLAVTFMHCKKKKKEKEKWRILLRISSVFCAVSFIKDNHNRLGFSMEHFAQIYLLSHEIYTNRLIMCVNLFHFQDRIFRQDPI